MTSKLQHLIFMTDSPLYSDSSDTASAQYPQIRQQIRHTALTQRRQLSFCQQQSAEKALCRQLKRVSAYRRARSVALYLSTASEAGTARLLKMVLRDGKRCFLPVLHPWQKHKMLFVRYTGAEFLRSNRWGIKEPQLAQQRCLKPTQLDLVILPLVAFDMEGHRLGMGKGYYDRAFAFRCQTEGKPFLLGLAHECQLAGQLLPVAAWDVDLDAVATADRIITFRANRSVPLHLQER
ncbi:MAG: 5-formyltetrahydrofolate cyclo-ligase [Pseudohongiella sp.]|nr:5-formyltetrahydrofolate cyclo-ligase [Pseudohongiella sp.]